MDLYGHLEAVELSLTICGKGLWDFGQFLIFVKIDFEAYEKVLSGHDGWLVLCDFGFFLEAMGL